MARAAVASAFEKRLQDLAAEISDQAKRAAFLEEMKGFRALVERFNDKSKNMPIQWEKIKPPAENMIVPFASLPACPREKAQGLLKKLAVLKLNGGLGTTMGCTGPKSAIEVRNDMTFLDLTVRQVELLNKEFGTDVPLVLMNSFNTHDDTDKIITKYRGTVPMHTFNQSRYPRLMKESGLPMPSSMTGQQEAWYPPGHGDLFAALSNSGVLQRLRDEGREYLFVSNADNLGASVDLAILHHIVSAKLEYVMEVTDKTAADVKGGTLIDYEGRVKLLEIAQVPSSKVDEFKSVKKFKIFNTNNIWISLSAIAELQARDAFADMDIILNPKVEGGKAIIQLERAVGAAIQYFRSAQGINVPRSRFVPVKSTGDLLVVQSSLYTVKDGLLVMNPKRPFASVPVVKLGDEFKKVGDYLRRFKSIPDILELDHLTVSGDVTFGEGCRLKGTVVLVANSGQHIDLPPRTVLANQVVTGNLRILDH
jgi:UTP--glucose-1-phosphate uridylyltransferase